MFRSWRQIWSIKQKECIMTIIALIKTSDWAGYCRNIAFWVAWSHRMEGSDYLWLKTELSLQIVQQRVRGVPPACQAIQSAGITQRRATTVANGEKMWRRGWEKAKYLCKQRCISNMSCKNTLKRFSFISRWFKTMCLCLRCDAFNSLIKNHTSARTCVCACVCVFPPLV